MKKSILIFVILIFDCPTFAGTKLPTKCEAGLPSIFLQKLVKESELEALQSRGLWGQDQKTNKYWTVYSDRCNNVTFSKPSLNSKQFDELKFGEQVRIAIIRKDFALVYTEPHAGCIYPLISNKARCRGWIPMGNLLLWQCSVDEIGLYKKAFIGLNVDSLRKYKADKLVEKTSVYLHPEKNVKNTEKNYYTSRDICFVMKQEYGRYLLSKTPDINQLDNMTLLGWFTPSTIIRPVGNVFLEPNWHPSVVEELKGKRISVFDREGRKSLEFEIGRTNNITLNPSTKYRPEPEYMRLLLKDNASSNDNKYVVTAFVRPDGCYDGECVQGAFTGYVEKKDSVTSLDYFQLVALYSSDELAYLMEKLQAVMSAANTGNRKPYVAMLEFTRSMIPDITGLLDGRTLIQIQDENVVKQDEFDGMIANFQIKFRKLKKIRENKYDFSIERNKTTWYWIPVEDLP